MKWILSLLLPLSVCYSLNFEDSQTGLQLALPSSFELVESDQTEIQSWYMFANEAKDILLIEIEKFEEVKPSSEYFTYSMINDYSYYQKEQIHFESLKFETFPINDLEICQCALRILAVEEGYRKHLYLCDYLFVKGCFGFTISLLKIEDGSDPEKLMQPVISSLSFVSEQ